LTNRCGVEGLKIAVKQKEALPCTQGKMERQASRVRYGSCLVSFVSSMTIFSLCFCTILGAPSDFSQVVFYVVVGALLNFILPFNVLFISTGPFSKAAW